MEHPFLSTSDLAELTLEELQEKISNLTSKLNFAYQTNNTALISQVSMALESYNTARSRKLSEMFPKDKGEDHTDKINIS